IFKAVDDGISARSHRTIPRVIGREGEDTGCLKLWIEAQFFHRVEAHTQRIANRFWTEEAWSGGVHGGRVMGPCVIDDEILVPVESGIAIVGDVAGEIRDAVPSPVHSIT